MITVHHAKINQYIDTVCTRIKCREVHSGIRLEIEGHMFDLIDEYKESGMSYEDAIDQAIRQMGDPIHLGKQFHKAHKPRMEWYLLGVIAFFCLIGLVTLYSIDLLNPSGYPFYLKRQLIWIAIGSMLFMFFYFIDYRKIKSISMLIFTLTISHFLIIKTLGLDNSNFLHLGITSVNMSDFFLMGMILSLPGIFSKWNWEDRYAWLKAMTILILPSVLLWANSSSKIFVFLFLVLFFVIVVVSKAPRKQLIVLFSGAVAIIGGIVLMILKKPYMLDRFLAIFDIHKYQQGASYQLSQSLEMIQSAGFWGHGIGAGSRNLLPAMESDFIFSYIIYIFGWIAGALIIASVLFFIIRTVRSFQVIQDRYGSMVVLGITTVLAIKFLYAIVMTLGIVPTVGVAIPFISYGGTSTVMSMLLMGYVLGIYRRKDMIKV